MKTYTILFALLVSSLVLSSCTPAEEPAGEAGEMDAAGVVLEERWILSEGFDRPESAIYDAERDVIYVSNIVGEADAMDGDGYIAKVSADGEMVETRWVDGLDAPKGMAIREGTLYATDNNALVLIDVAEAIVTDRYEVEGDAFLNDVTVGPGGDVFVSDSRFSKIYKMGEEGLEIWLESPQIEMPNGLHVIGDALYAVAGDSTQEDPGASRYMQRISPADKSVSVVYDTEPRGALDAVEPDGQGGIFVSNWGSGELMHFDERSGYTVLRQLGQGCADVDYVAETGMLYVPVMMDHELRAYSVTLP